MEKESEKKDVRMSTREKLAANSLAKWQAKQSEQAQLLAEVKKKTFILTEKKKAARKRLRKKRAEALRELSMEMTALKKKVNKERRQATTEIQRESARDARSREIKERKAHNAKILADSATDIAGMYAKNFPIKYISEQTTIPQRVIIKYLKDNKLWISKLERRTLRRRFPLAFADIFD